MCHWDPHSAFSLTKAVRAASLIFEIYGPGVFLMLVMGLLILNQPIDPQIPL